MNEELLLKIIYDNLDFDRIEQHYPDLNKERIKRFFNNVKKSLPEEEKQYKKLYLYTDGASRGNPGISGIGIVLLSEDREVISEENEYIGKATNNVAEYRALIKGLEKVKKYNPGYLEINSDSELLVKQLNGIYKVKSHAIIPLYRQAVELLTSFEQFSVQHIPRKYNDKADRQANLAIEEYLKSKKYLQENQ